MKPNPAFASSWANRYTVERRWYGKPVVYDHKQKKIVPSSKGLWSKSDCERLRVLLAIVNISKHRRLP